MKNDNTTFHPINALEKKIFRDKEFQMAIKTGKSRKFHREGSVKNHIINILEYIDNKYKSATEYDNLRLLVILHDVGKYASVEKRQDILLPKMPKTEQNKFIISSRTFAKKYSIPKSVQSYLKEFKYTPKHAYVSYLFSKKFTKNKRILKIIRYHDAGIDFKLIFHRTGKYDVKKFKDIYSKLDLDLYLMFVDCDRLGQESDEIPWIKEQLQMHKLFRQCL